MKKYKVEKGFQWKDCTFYGEKVGAVITESDLKTGDGQPLPAAVVAVLLKKGNLVEVTE